MAVDIVCGGGIMGLQMASARLCRKAGVKKQIQGKSALNLFFKTLKSISDISPML